MSLGAIELRVSDGNALNISQYIVVTLDLRQGACKVEMLAI